MKSFAINYTMFVAFEVLDAGISSAIFPSALILSMEWVSAEHSTLVSSLILSTSPIGQMATAFIASHVKNYKWLLRVLSLFGLLTIPYIWLVPESFRWLLINRKYNEALDVIGKAAKVNKIDLSPRTYAIIANKCNIHKTNETDGQVNDDNSDRTSQKCGSFKDIITDRTLFIRLLLCTYCWATAAYLTYGVSVISVSFSGNRYTNFMIVALGGVPATISTYLMMKYLCRRWAMCASFILTAASIFASKYFSSNVTLPLILFFIGKMSVQHSFNSLYLYTNEMWPTILRHTVMGMVSTIARVGSLAAPLTPLLVWLSLECVQTEFCFKYLK